MSPGSAIPAPILEPIAENLKISDRAFVKYDRPEDCSGRKSTTSGPNLFIRDVDEVVIEVLLLFILDTQ